MSNNKRKRGIELQIDVERGRRKEMWRDGRKGFRRSKHKKASEILKLCTKNPLTIKLKRK